MRTAVVTGCNAAFAEGAAILLRDFRRYHPDVKRYCITPEADAESVRQTLGELAEVFPVTRPIDVGQPSMPHALLKLYTPLVDADIAVWVDCDMVLCRPVPELWNVEPGEVVGVLDTAFKLRFMVEPSLYPLYEKQFPDIVEKRGINTGLFGLRTNEWQDLPERYEKAFKAGGYTMHPKIWDQPFLNGLMHSRIRVLPYAFNAHHLFDYHIPRDVRIVHFTNIPKPWMDGYPQHEPAYYYWLKYGMREDRLFTLAMVKLRIWLRTPRRLLSRYINARRNAIN